MSQGRSFLGTAFKIAWRESRASGGKFLFVIFAVAVGVGSLTGVRGFSQALSGLLQREARTLMAADVSARLNQPLNDEQTATIASLAKRGVSSTRITEMLSMVGSSHSDNPVPVSLKAIDPAQYPFYGSVTRQQRTHFRRLAYSPEAQHGRDIPGRRSRIQNRRHHRRRA